MARRGIAWSQLRIGLVVTFAVTMTAFAVFFIDEVSDRLEKRYPLHFHTSTTQSLRIRTPVWLAGQAVGVVDRLDFRPPDEDQKGRLTVGLAVNIDAAELITDGAAVEIITAGLLGEAVVNIRPATVPGPPLPAGSEIPAALEIDPSQVTLRAQAFYADLRPVLDRWRQVRDTALAGDGTIGRLMQNLDELRLMQRNLRQLSVLFGNISDAANSVRDFVSEDEIQAKLGRVPARVERLHDLWRARDGSAGHLLSDSSLARHMEGLAGSLARISERLDTGRGSLGRFLNDRALETELERTRRQLAELRAGLLSPRGQDPRRR
ncbi:MAG: MCE family protein [Gemmatimonadota bacterium]|nr:MAG: MCE family protein [Gemmatimonadota bacterium]